MAANNEHRLISRAIRDRTITSILEAGVRDDWFVDPGCKEVWRWLVSHWSKYGEVATPVSVKDEFPTFPILKVDDTVEYLLDRFVAYRRYVKIEDTIQGAAEILSLTHDHDAALLLIEGRLSEIHQEGVPGVSDMHLERDPLSRYAQYEEMEKTAGRLLGLPTGFSRIDDATAGLQKGQLVTIIAPPKTGKSMIALQTAINIHEAGHNVLFQSFEMSNTEQQTRHDAMRSKVSHARMQRRALTDPEKGNYERMLRHMTTLPHAFTLADAVQGITVSALAAKIDQVKPSVAFVDGVYLMQDEQTGESNTPQALTSITRGLKRMAQRMNIPVVITTQTLLWKMKGGKVSADSIGYSSSFFQDSDVILGLEEIPDDDEARSLRVVASRNCGPEEASLVWRWDTGCFHDDESSATCRGCITASRFAPRIPTSDMFPSPDSQ